MSPARDKPFPLHGGDLAFATARYGAPDSGWLDLSTGVNPVPYPAEVDAAAVTRLPTPAALDGLIAAARDAYAIPEGMEIAAVPGSEVAIRLLPYVASPGTVAVVTPTYASHADAWKRAGRTVAEVSRLGAIADAAVAIIGNPNNPDGRMTERGALAEAAGRLGRRGGLLVVDEAFADAVPGVSLAPCLEASGAVVLRSFGKFYGLPGLRLGFAAGDTAVVSRLRDALGAWPVSWPAVEIGTAALRNHVWQAATRARLAAGAARLRAMLTKHGLALHGGTDLFVLVESADAHALHERLARRGVWTRAFENQPTWLRLGLPGDDAAFALLDRAFSAAR